MLIFINLGDNTSENNRCRIIRREEIWVLRTRISNRNALLLSSATSTGVFC